MKLKRKARRHLTFQNKLSDEEKAREAMDFAMRENLRAKFKKYDEDQEALAYTEKLNAQDREALAYTEKLNMIDRKKKRRELASKNKKGNK